MKNIRLEDRLIFALDVPEVVDAKEIVSELDDSVNFYKIGMEMLMTGQYFELLDWLIRQDKKVFVDLKFFDVPETVGRTIARLSDYGATFATIHGNQALMEKAAANKGNLKILAVTALTSLDRGDLDDLGFTCNVKDLVISRAKRAFEAGCDGIVSSGLEVPFIREYVDDKLISLQTLLNLCSSTVTFKYAISIIPPLDDRCRLLQIPSRSVLHNKYLHFQHYGTLPQLPPLL